MSIGKVDPGFDYKSVGMINAERWSGALTAVFTAAVWGALGWRWALLYLAVALTLRVEGRRVREALWPTSYHVMRVIMDEHGFKHDGEPQIYGKR
jgi:hypothetical protein